MQPVHKQHHYKKPLLQEDNYLKNYLYEGNLTLFCYPIFRMHDATVAVNTAADTTDNLLEWR